METQPAGEYNHGSKRKIPHAVIVRAPGLLPMYYKASELAEELCIPERTLRDWLTNGAPCIRDDRNSIWIEGESFARWVEQERKNKTRIKLEADEAFCLHCKKPVKMTDCTEKHIVDGISHLSGTCPECGGKVVRGEKNG